MFGYFHYSQAEHGSSLVGLAWVSFEEEAARTKETGTPGTVAYLKLMVEG